MERRQPEWALEKMSRVSRKILPILRVKERRIKTFVGKIRLSKPWEENRRKELFCLRSQSQQQSREKRSGSEQHRKGGGASKWGRGEGLLGKRGVVKSYRLNLKNSLLLYC